jgi:hypothetical protein
MRSKPINVNQALSSVMYASTQECAKLLNRTVKARVVGMRAVKRIADEGKSTGINTR